MPEPGVTFIEDELERPFKHLIAWTHDGRGVEVCIDTQLMRIPAHTEVEDDHGSKVRLIDKLIRARLLQTGVRFKKRPCEFCGGFHLERLDAPGH